MKKTLPILIFLFTIKGLDAQNKKNDLIITGGWGINAKSISQTVHYDIPDYWGYNINVDRHLSKRTLIGLGFMYQEFENYRNRTEAHYYGKNYANARVRLLVNWINKPSINIYSCLAAGFTYDSEEFDFAKYQLQGLIGSRYYLNESISLNLEAGLGYPYFASAGVSYRIRKNN